MESTFESNHISDLGTGIYTIPDVAAILRLPVKKVRRWMHEYWNAKFGGLAQTQFSVGMGKEEVTNFYTLIEFFTFYQLRERGVTAQKIIQAHQVLATHLNVAYPFATSNVFTDGKSVFFQHSEISQIIHADETLQIVIREVLNLFLKKIEFDSDQLAKRFFPMGKDHNVIIDPQRQFGQPVVGETNVLTESLYQLYKGGESAKTIATIYDLPEQDVKDAINFHRNAA